MIWKLAVTALCAYSAFGCSNSSLLKQTGHLDLGVKLSGNTAFIQAETEALNYWSKVLNMSWHRDDSNSCSIEFRPVNTIASFRDDGAYPVAGAHLPSNHSFDGIIYFKYANGYDKRLVFEHELGHLFGLEHDSDVNSVMYYDPSLSGGELEQIDLRQLRRLHSTR